MPPSSFVLRYAVVTRRHYENRLPSFTSPQSNLTCSALSASLVPEKSSLRTVFPLTNPITFLFASDGVSSLFFTSNLPISPGRSTRSVDNFLDYVKTTGFDGARHAVDKIDATSKALELPSEDIP